MEAEGVRMKNYNCPKCQNKMDCDFTLIFNYQCHKCQIFISSPWEGNHDDWILSLKNKYYNTLTHSIRGNSFDECVRKFNLKSLW